MKKTYRAVSAADSTGVAMAARQGEEGHEGYAEPPFGGRDPRAIARLASSAIAFPAALDSPRMPQPDGRWLRVRAAGKRPPRNICLDTHPGNDGVQNERPERGMRSVPGKPAAVTSPSAARGRIPLASRSGMTSPPSASTVAPEAPVKLVKKYAGEGTVTMAPRRPASGRKWRQTRRSNRWGARLSASR